MYRATISFSGAIIMKKNEIREIKDKKLVKDLLKAGYIEEYKSSTPKELEKENETLKKALDDATATIEELNKKIDELNTEIEKANIPVEETQPVEGNSDETQNSNEE